MERSKNPLENLGKIKDTLSDLFLEDELVQKLIMPVPGDSQLSLKETGQTTALTLRCRPLPPGKTRPSSVLRQTPP